MEYLRGLTIYEVVTRDGPQPIGRVLSVLRQICDALIEAHAKELCHRDIKPHNIMLAPDAAAGDWAVVFDYGLAKPLRPDKGVFQTAETLWAGTPMYMAPERFRQPGEMDPRSDIYSTGAVAYFMLAGRPPFLESDPESLFALILSEEPIRISLHRGTELPPEIDQLVHRMMAKDVADRFESMVQLATEIDRLRVDYPWTFEESNQWWKVHGDDETDKTASVSVPNVNQPVTK
jgi:eukaryotic-like serine/threonine-protein kinase